jgi:hypothetical protein
MEPKAVDSGRFEVDPWSRARRRKEKPGPLSNQVHRKRNHRAGTGKEDLKASLFYFTTPELNT